MRGKKSFFRNAKLLLSLLVAAFFLGGCGSSDDPVPSSEGKVFVIGELHGDLKEELASACNVVPYDGNSVKGTIIISDPQGQNSWFNEENIAKIKKTFANGKTVAIEGANEDEVNFFLDRLLSSDKDGVASTNLDYRMPEGMTYVSFYGIKMLSGDLFSYIVFNGEENQPVVLDEIAPTRLVASGDSYVTISQDVTKYDHDRIDTFHSGDITLTVKYDLKDNASYLISADGLPKASMDELDFPVLLPGRNNISDVVTSGDIRERKLQRARGVLEWIENSSQQAEDVEKSRVELEASLNREASGSTDLTKVSQVYSVTHDIPNHGYNVSFKIEHSISACHSYNSADGSDSDWFFIKQVGSFNPSNEYQNKKHTSKYRALCGRYIHQYGFYSWPVDYRGYSDSRAILEGQSSPGSTVNSSTVESSSSYNFSGSVGFNASTGVTGGVSGGVSYSSSQSFTASDCQIVNNSAPQNNPMATDWNYSFPGPRSDGGPIFVGGVDLRDAPLCSRSNFQPVNQWIWRVPKEAREDIAGFNYRFLWELRYTHGESFAFWITVDHLDEYSKGVKTHEAYISFPHYPPLIAANDITLGKQAQFTPVEMATCRDWTASSDQPWCKLNRDSGTMNEIGKLTVTVEENNTGADRIAVITLKTKDGKGRDTFEVMQSYVSKAN